VVIIKTKEKQNIVEEVRKTAEKYFRKGDYYCSESVLTTINDTLGQEFRPEIVKLASGFPIGVGKSGCLCGAVSGGVMALGSIWQNQTRR